MKLTCSFFLAAVPLLAETMTPEPATFGLMAIGIAGMGFVAYKMKNRK